MVKAEAPAPARVELLKKDLRDKDSVSMMSTSVAYCTPFVTIFMRPLLAARPELRPTAKISGV
jgi:hypothetical protein